MPCRGNSCEAIHEIFDFNSCVKEAIHYKRGEGLKRTEKAAVLAELARRELARRHYSEYLAYVQGSDWKRTKMSEFIAAKLQEFIEADTGSAYDILVIQTPPQHGKTATVTETLPSWYLGK